MMKKLDYWIGIPFIYTLGLFHKKCPLPKLDGKLGVYRFVLIKTAAIGDTVLLSAVIRELKHAYPNCHITIVCSRNNLAMVRLLTDVNEIFEFNMSRPISSLGKLSMIKKTQILFDFAPWARINSLISWKIKGAFKVGFYRKNMYRHYIYDGTVEHRDNVHELDNYRSILQYVQIPLQNYEPVINVNYEKPLELIPNVAYVVFHLFPGGASAHLRSWENEKWTQLAKKIFETYGYAIAFTGGKEDKEKSEDMANSLKRFNIPAHSLSGKISLAEAVVLVKRAKLLVTVNTGIMHVGAAVGVPLIALHGATSDRRWGPLSSRAVVIKSNEKCQPCISLGFESKCHNPICMQNITVDMVWKVVQEQLS
jgi:lipopolysaccharide heptosyltransferase II